MQSLKFIQQTVLYNFRDDSTTEFRKRRPRGSWPRDGTYAGEEQLGGDDYSAFAASIAGWCLISLEISHQTPFNRFGYVVAVIKCRHAALSGLLRLILMARSLVVWCSKDVKVLDTEDMDTSHGSGGGPSADGKDD
jgi:hypothetical protein